jgi:phage portal protein BeeE
MKLFNFEFGVKAAPKPTAEEGVGDVYNGIADSANDGIMKAYIPYFLYKPPFGYPRKDNVPLIRQLAMNPYVYSVIRTLCDEVASTKWSIRLKEDVDMTPRLEEAKKEIMMFLNNPNKNKESFETLLRAATKDLLELDSGVWVKVFNEFGELKQVFARDGGTFLKNPDIHGYMGNRAAYVKPLPVEFSTVQPTSPDWQVSFQRYRMSYDEVAAYYQYGWTAASLPVPFGRQEIVYFMANPQSNSIYGISPVQILADIVTSLIFGSYYNLDFYQNNNMPEGIISVINADQKSITAFRERMNSVIKKVDESTGFSRKIGFRIPIVNQEAKFTPFQLTPQAMEIIQQQQWFTKIVWMCFGVTADEMGFTENSNRATGQNQLQVYKRKAVRPLLELFRYHINMEVISEWGDEVFQSLEFHWEDYDLDEEIKRHTLFETQLRIGVTTPEMICEEEGIDYQKVKAYKDERDAKELEKANAQAIRFNQSFNPDNKPSPNMPAQVGEKALKAESFENDLERDLVTMIKDRAKQLEQALDQYKNGELDKIQ